MAAIRQSKSRPLSRLIYALGIRHVGEKAAYVLARQFRTMDAFLKARKEDFDSIAEIGPVIAQSIKDYLSLGETRKLVEAFRRHGLNFQEETAEAKSTPFTGKNVVFTGELEKYSRFEAEELLRGQGGNPSSGVSKSTDLVVAGASPGSKLDKARKLGIKIINEKDFLRLLEE